MKKRFFALTIAFISVFSVQAQNEKTETATEEKDKTTMYQPPPTTTSEPEGVAKFTFKKDRTLAIHYLMQSWAYAPEHKNNVYGSDFMIRRNRVLFVGQLNKMITFFAQSDDARIGRDGEGKNVTKTFFQDAFISFKFAEEFQLSTGMILLPFSHHNRASAIRLLGVEYNLKAIKLPNTNAFRNTGLEARGLIADGLIAYNLGVFDGLDDKNDTNPVNENDNPRISGRLAFNFMDTEKGFFLNDNPHTTLNLFTIGFGGDYQQQVRFDKDNKKADNMNAVADMIINYVIGKDAINFHAAFFNYDNADFKGGTTPSGFSGITYFAQMGYYIGSVGLQPTIQYVASETDKDKYGSVEKSAYITPGISWFVDGHKISIKSEFAYGIEDTDNNQFLAQAQIFL